MALSETALESPQNNHTTTKKKKEPDNAQQYLTCTLKEVKMRRVEKRSISILVRWENMGRVQSK